ncbi:hypothetical protein ANO14919_062580 [Xylariales sp. No.14919]|nr:hypothetical protein ANO14919_062580 [Xylariales sp. No.14919]
MSPDVSFSSVSHELLVDDNSTDTDDSSCISSEDMHIGISPRPQLPLILSNNSISKSLPSRLSGGIVPRVVGPSPRSQSARPHQTGDYHQRAPSYSPRPQPYPPPLFPPSHPRPPPPPLTQPVSGTLLRPLDRHGRWRSDSAESQYGYGDRGHGNDRDSCFSSWQESNDPEIEAKEESDYVRDLTENYVGLREQRSALLTVLDTVKSQGVHIRKLRQSEDEADRKFMAAARALLLDSTELDQLQQLFKALQDTRLEYREAEKRFEETVDELHQGQEALSSREEAFYEAFTGASGIALFNLNNDRDSSSDNSEDWVLRGITGDRPENIHPLYEKLREAFGELQLAKELLVNTQMKREALHARKIQPLGEDSLSLLETYGNAGKKKALELRAMALMTEEDMEQLRDYDELERDARRDIDIYTEKVVVLRQECSENGALPLSSYFQQEGFGVDSFYRDEIRLASGPFESNDESTTLAHPVFPLLLSNPTHLLHGFPQTALQSLRNALQLPLNAPVRAKQVKEAAREANMHTLLSTVESEDKSEYINRWLLHKLHHSALEAELLWTTFRSRLQILDIDRWQRDVLHFWWRDKPVGLAPVDIGDNETNKAVGSLAEFNLLSHSDSGQLDGLRKWNLDDSWL